LIVKAAMTRARRMLTEVSRRRINLEFSILEPFDFKKVAGTAHAGIVSANENFNVMLELLFEFSSEISRGLGRDSFEFLVN